ncbi:MAG: hypothetical protein QM740_14680 [Acidovorax sp.]
MSNSVWELLPRTGIESSSIKIAFGMERQELQGMMSKEFSAPESNYPDEDDFISADKSTFIRVRYEDSRVKDIEFLAGTLMYQGINLHFGTTFTELKKKFGDLGLSFRLTEWLGDGQDCQELGINIATHEDVGSDGDEIEWVILSSDFG